MKVNIKGYIALVGLVCSSLVLGYDFIRLLNGATYTWFGFFTAIACVFIGCECENYIVSRLK